MTLLDAGIGASRFALATSYKKVRAANGENTIE